MAHEGQILKARTVTRLIREQEFNSAELNKILLPPHDSEPRYQEPQEDRLGLQELLRSFIMQQKSKMQNKDFKPLDQRFEVIVEHAGTSITASPAERANQQSSSLPASSTSTSASQPAVIPQPVIPQPPEFQMPPGLHPLHLHHAQQPGPVRPQQSAQQPVQVRRRITKKSSPTESAEISAVLQDIKENHLPITQDEINADHQEAQSEGELLQGLILQEWYQGDLQGYSADQIRKQSQKSSSKSVLKVMMPMTLLLLVISVKKNIDQSLNHDGS